MPLGADCAPESSGEGGYQRRWQKGDEVIYFVEDSDIVGFVCAPPDEHGFHGGLNVSTNSIAFPPHTLFRLKEIREPGTWVAPGNVRPQQRLLVKDPDDQVDWAVKTVTWGCKIELKM